MGSGGPGRLGAVADTATALIDDLMTAATGRTVVLITHRPTFRDRSTKGFTYRTDASAAGPCGERTGSLDPARPTLSGRE